MSSWKFEGLASVQASGKLATDAVSQPWFTMNQFFRISFIQNSELQHSVWQGGRKKKRTMERNNSWLISPLLKVKLVQGEATRDVLRALLLSFEISFSFSCLIFMDIYKEVCNINVPDEAVSRVSGMPRIMKHINKRGSRSDLISPLGYMGGQRDVASQHWVSVAGWLCDIADTQRKHDLAWCH